MTRRHERGNQRYRVLVKHTPAPDAQERLRRAYDLILRAAVRDENKHASEERDEKGAVDHEC